MPCDSIAVIQTKIKQEVFNKILTPELLKKILPDLVVSEMNDRVTSINQYGESVRVRFDSGYEVTITKDEISTRYTYPRYSTLDARSAKAKQLEFEQRLATLLQQIGIKAIQSAVRETVVSKSKGITFEKYDPQAKCYVLEVEV